MLEEALKRGQPPMSIRWVCSEKHVNNDLKIKRGLENPHRVGTGFSTEGTPCLS